MVLDIIRYCLLGVSILCSIVLFIINFSKADKEKKQQIIASILASIPSLCSKAETIYKSISGEKLGEQRSAWVQDQVKLMALENGVKISNDLVQSQIDACIDLKNIDKKEN